VNQPRPAAPVTAQIRLPDQSAVRLEGVTVRRNGVTALDDLDLTIPRNICFGIAGNPGSGLDLLADVIATRRRPNAGSVHVVGFDASAEPDEIRRRLGYLSHPHTVPPHLRVDEYLTIQAAAMGVPRDRWGSLVDTLLTLVGIAGRQQAFTHELSPAARQLLAVAGALVHDPSVVVLNEPTEGLDARARARLWNMLHRLGDVSRTVVVCSRHLSELSTGCAQVAVLDAGRIADHGPPTDVVGRLGGARRIRARLANGAVRTHTVADEAAQAALLHKLVLAGVELVEFAEVAPELDDLRLSDTSQGVARATGVDASSGPDANAEPT
jgi:ABC-type multidrug transport system ATPase subunit